MTNRVIVLKRGFKSQAEKLAEKYRVDLRIHPCAPLCAFKLAEHLGINVYPATEILKDPNDIDILKGSNGNDCEWSALTMVTQLNNRIIIFNPFHSAPRQQSDLMHEIAHIICKHSGTKKDYSSELPIGLISYDPEMEEEAKCLGSTLQLAKPCLLWTKKNNMTDLEIADYYNASAAMVKYRMNMTGIGKKGINWKKTF